MSPILTPVADDLTELARQLDHAAFTGRPLGQSALEVASGRLLALAERTGRLERFHSQIVSEAQEDELLAASPPTGTALWLENFRAAWNLPRC